jgi:Domain of unknown function (DUF4902)
VSHSSPSCMVFTNTKRSLDGYIRLTFDAFSSLNFQRKLAWEDDGLQQDLIVDDIPASCAGYCEWATEDAPAKVSIGWAWFSLADGRTFVAPGGMSSNVMLVTATGYDLGTHKTSELLHAWLAREPWQASESTTDFDILRSRS